MKTKVQKCSEMGSLERNVICQRTPSVPIFPIQHNTQNISLRQNEIDRAFAWSALYTCFMLDLFLITDHDNDHKRIN